MANKKYWKTIGERDKDPQVLEKHLDEFGGSGVAESIANWSEDSKTMKVSRKTFLKMAGFTLGATTLAGCRDKVFKIVPYLVRPEGITPGVAYSYASTCLACPCGCGVLTKNRDGRPIKIEGNPNHPISRGGTCAIAQAEVMALYDSYRYQGPQVGDKTVSFKELDLKIFDAFTAVRRAKGTVRVVTGTVNSPTLQRSIYRFTQTFSHAQHISYDSLSQSALADSYLNSHGRRFIPHYRFDKAEVILSLDADFLGTWISPVEFAKDYAAGRKVSKKKSYSRHLQIESNLSLTGSNADNRWALRASQIPVALGYIVRTLAGGKAPSAARSLVAPSPLSKKIISTIVSQLKAAKGRSLVVCGINDPAAQGLVNWLNAYLGNEGNTVEVNRPSRQKLGDDKKMKALMDEVLAGKVDALIFAGCNPVYDLPEGKKLAEAIKKVGLSISLAVRPDETSSLCQFVSPASHWLESWGDSEAVAGWISPVQPAVERTTESREDFVSFARFFGSDQSAYELVQQTWKEEIMPRTAASGSFQKFWDTSLSVGAVKTKAPQRVSRRKMSPPSVKAGKAAGLELVLYPKIGIQDGSLSHNPYLQELSDPVSKVVWDNYAAMNPETAKSKDLERGDIIKITYKGLSRDLPVLPQPGTPKDVIAIAVGYGTQASKRFSKVGPQWISKNNTIEEGETVGQSVSAFRQRNSGYLGLVVGEVSITKTGGKHTLAATQEYDSLYVPTKLAPGGEAYRENIVQETTIEEILAGKGAAHRDDVSKMSLYDPHEYPLHHWGLSIDMNSCNGCSACVVACQIENNISVVGKDEVNRGRDMNWLRIDRYYADGAQKDGADIEVAHQPMMCQHCDNAPCEAVCPTAATQHSSEGLNDMAYNRCIGTRYCANNCPYKVRRFNWFNFPLVDPEYAQALNPDVTVRTRGVMEKCSMCVHRIEDARALSKSEGRPMHDGDIQTACQQACPTEAIIFGDQADKASRLVKLQKDARAYELLEELNVKSAVRYHSMVRNPIPGSKPNHEKNAHG